MSGSYPHRDEGAAAGRADEYYLDYGGSCGARGNRRCGSDARSDRFHPRRYHHPRLYLSQHRLLDPGQIGANRARAVDIQAACTGYLYALSMAKALVEAGPIKIF